jgi:dsRNA-specific ribonuclease
MLGRKGTKCLEDVFEAFCAAIIEDLGVAVLQLFIKHLLERNVDFNDIILFDDDYKSMLLQLYQRHGWTHPTYRMLSQLGPGHKKEFNMGVDYIDEFAQLDTPLPCENHTVIVKDKLVDENGNVKLEEKAIDCRILATGKARSKKEAEQLASKAALEAFGMIV